jgi:hypothetical protein
MWTDPGNIYKCLMFSVDYDLNIDIYYSQSVIFTGLAIEELTSQNMEIRLHFNSNRKKKCNVMYS